MDTIIAIAIKIVVLRIKSVIFAKFQKICNEFEKDLDIF